MNHTQPTAQFAPREFLPVRVAPLADATHEGGVDIPADLLDLLNLTPGDFEFFQRWGYRKLAVQMLTNEAKTLAADPFLQTAEGRLSHDWVAGGVTGVLPFDTCLAWAGLYDLNGAYLDDRIRNEMLMRPESIVRAFNKVESLLDSHEQRDTSGGGATESMTLSERIEFVYADEDFSIECDGYAPGTPVFVDLVRPEADTNRQRRGAE